MSKAYLEQNKPLEIQHIKESDLKRLKDFWNGKTITDNFSFVLNLYLKYNELPKKEEKEKSIKPIRVYIKDVALMKTNMSFADTANHILNWFHTERLDKERKK